jgi:N-methylhydantoinase A/oxoprolinase/acetone carboxylase beta subunit
MLERAGDKAAPVVQQLIAEYGLDRDQAILVGEGGGAGALIPFLAERMGLPYLISKDAEVISSIGVALALVREMVERLVPDPQPDDLKAIRREAFDAVVRMGANPRSVHVTVEIDPHTQHVRATAVGAVEMDSTPRTVISEDRAQAIAAASLGVPPEATCVVASTDRVRVIQASVSGRRPVRVVDLEGAVRLQRSEAQVQVWSVEQAVDVLERHWKAARHPPDLMLVAGGHFIDLSSCASIDQACTVARAELDGLAPDTTVVVMAMPGLRR